MKKDITNLRMKDCMLAQINEIDIMYLNYISENLEKQDSDYMKKYWIKELNDYINIFEKKLLNGTQITPSSHIF
jgi:hypothetical protein